MGKLQRKFTRSEFSTHHWHRWHQLHDDLFRQLINVSEFELELSSGFSLFVVQSEPLCAVGLPEQLRYWHQHISAVSKRKRRETWIKQFFCVENEHRENVNTYRKSSRPMSSSHASNLSFTSEGLNPVIFTPAKGRHHFWESKSRMF